VDVQVPLAMDVVVMPLTVSVSRAPLSGNVLAQRVSNLNAVTQLTNFTDFATSLENIHNGVHDWVGGTMGLLETAAADPIFWMHHANIDRIWWQWQQSAQGTGKNPNLADADAIMDPWRYNESQTRDIANFNYTYA
jgi:tyrosinase